MKDVQEKTQWIEQNETILISQSNNKEAILYICHGSRVKQAQEQAIAFVKSCMDESLASIQEYCFLELAQPTIEAAFRACVEKGAKKIIAVPLLLLTAAHAKVDIPNELMRVKKLFPGIDVAYSQPIGVHSSIPAIIQERILESNQQLTKDSIVLLVGRGSSDPDVKRDLREIADMLKNHLKLERVDTSFLVAASPSFEEALQNARNTNYKKMFVIPYLLFTGILMKNIDKMIQVHKQQTDQDIILCSYLGYHPALKKILYDRIMEAKKTSL